MNNINNNLDKFNLINIQKQIIDVKFDLSETKYEFLENIGIGAYGIVCQAKNTEDDRDYAIKKIKNPFSHKITLIRTLREIRILNQFNHSNIISIVDIFLKQYNDNKDIYVVFDLMESDLHKIIISKQDLSDDHIRYFLYQILCGINYIHSASIIHRDLKPANILINSNCHLKIADFGMSRLFVTPIKYDGKISENAINFNMTQYVMTRWYRAPELLMGQLSYNTKIDLWSCGCILAELYLKTPLFCGDNMINQLKEIIRKMGIPHSHFRQKILPVVNFLINNEGEIKYTSLNQLVPKAPKKVVDLLSHLLVYDPDQRWSAMQTLRHIFFLKYKNTSKEEICKSKLDLSFEVEFNTIDLLQTTLLNEILSSNKGCHLSSFSKRSVENEDLCTSIPHQVESFNRSESRISERTLSADSSKDLGYPITYFEYEKSFIQPACRSDHSEDTRLKTVSQFTKNKLINSIRNSKKRSKKKIVTAAQRQKERKERKLTLKFKRDEKCHTRKIKPISASCQEQLSELDKSCLRKWEHLTNSTTKEKSNKLQSINLKQCEYSEKDKNFDRSTNKNTNPESDEVQKMSAGLSAMLLDEIGYDSNNGTKSASNSRRSGLDLENVNLSIDNFDLLFDVDIDCIELDLNILESYSNELFKDEINNTFN